MKKTYQKVLLYYILFCILISGVTVVLWYLEKQYYDIPLNLTSENTLRYIGQISAFLSIVFLSLNFILAARFKFIEARLVGLDKMYRLHMFTGIAAFIFLTLHPVALALRFIDSPDIFNNYFIPFLDNSTAFNLGIVGFWLFVILIFIAGIRRIPYHWWKLAHSLLGIPLLFASAHAILAGSGAEFIPLEIWTASWIILAFISYIYKVFLYRFIGPRFDYKISRVETLQELVNVFLKPKKGSKQIQFYPGQFVFSSFNISGKLSEPHPYTISSHPKNSELRISIKQLGDWSADIQDVKPGVDVILFGPYGHFYQHRFQKFKRQVWIGGGIGITPFLSMVHDPELFDHTSTVHIIYSDNNAQQAVFHKELQQIAQNRDYIDYSHHLSDDEGYITEDYLRSKISYFKDTLFLMCGPTPMIESIKKILQKNSVSSERIVFEYFNFK